MIEVALQSNSLQLRVIEWSRAEENLPHEVIHDVSFGVLSVFQRNLCECMISHEYDCTQGGGHGEDSSYGRLT